nr:SDR family oxidoreductase [Microbacterium pygmaeum]
MLIAGATSASGAAAARALIAAGSRVIAVGRDAGRLEHWAATLRPAQGPDAQGPRTAAQGPGTAAGAPALVTEVCDLTDESDVALLADRVHDAHGSIDGILHLVGGWRGGGGLAGQTEEDYRFLEQSLTALRCVSRAFDADLRASEAGRSAIVSSTAVARPLAGGANYAAVKAASEAWARAVAQGFAKAARDGGEPLRAASVIFRVKALDGLEAQLADRYVRLFAEDADAINDTIVELSPA